MRRAAVQAFRTARRAPFRKYLVSRTALVASLQNNLRIRPVSSITRKDAPPQILHSSMYFRNFSLATFVAALASGLWYYQKGSPQDSRALVNGTSLRTSGTGFSPSQYSTLASASDSLPSSSKSTSPTSDTEPAAETKKRQLVVQEDGFYVDEISTELPLTKESESEGRMEMLTPEQATQKLRKTEESYLVGRGRGVVRYDLVQIASNNPIEDDHAEKIVDIPHAATNSQDGSSSRDWMFWGVFDGHSGWTTSAKLRQVLISYVARELDGVHKSAFMESAVTMPSPQSIDAAIKRGFLRLDHDIVHNSVEKVISNKKNTRSSSTELLAPALSGSCALLSFYDSSTRLFRVACTGDSRAVLGRKSASGKWTATPLSEDQTGGTPSEMARLRAEHPGEEFVVHKGRILGGLEPSRAFGDASYKWSREIADKMKSMFFGRTQSALLKSPPYVTAEPIITTTKVEPEKGDFVVLATDGLWEMLTNEEVIGLVGRWIEKNNKSGNTTASWAKSFFGGKTGDLPVEKPAGANDGKGQRAPLRQEQWSVKDSDERFVVEDKNVATHLVRNALGGRDNDLVCALLSLVSPNSRRYRDDLTVEVIFFGEGDKSGDVVMNIEATAPDVGLKAKL